MFVWLVENRTFGDSAFALSKSFGFRFGGRCIDCWLRRLMVLRGKATTTWRTRRRGYQKQYSVLFCQLSAKFLYRRTPTVDYVCVTERFIPGGSTTVLGDPRPFWTPAFDVHPSSVRPTNCLADLAARAAAHANSGQDRHSDTQQHNPPLHRHH